MKKRLTIMVPVFNERKTVGKVIRKILDLKIKDCEVIASTMEVRMGQERF